jgi:hypothetical protein
LRFAGIALAVVFGFTGRRLPPRFAPLCSENYRTGGTRMGAADALRLLDRGDWNGAHELVQDDGSKEAAWVHAHLHRVEGDLSNAAYWYRRAGRPEATGDFAEERRLILKALGD